MWSTEHISEVTVEWWPCTLVTGIHPPAPPLPLPCNFPDRADRISWDPLSLFVVAELPHYQMVKRRFQTKSNFLGFPAVVVLKAYRVLLLSVLPLLCMDQHSTCHGNTLFFYYYLHFLVFRFMESPWSRVFLRSMINAKQVQHSRISTAVVYDFPLAIRPLTPFTSCTCYHDIISQSACPFDHRGCPPSNITRSWWPSLLRT